MDATRRAALFGEIHRDLPREGPGDPASTRRALRRIQNVLHPSRIVDVGCGPGMQTVELAKATDATVLALDINRGYLDQLRALARRNGVGDRVRVIKGSMFQMSIRSSSLDLIWAEGAIYLIGFECGLQEWRDLLRHNGCLAVTHLSWLQTDVPDEPRRFWAKHYPAITTVGENVRIARALRYEVLDCFPLPASAWWTNYYQPLEDRLATLRMRYGASREVLAIIDSTQEQIDLYRHFPTSYGYVFYVLRRM
jgi:SAM-dependent methyltransferase